MNEEKSESEYEVKSSLDTVCLFVNFLTFPFFFFPFLLFINLCIISEYEANIYTSDQENCLYILTFCLSFDMLHPLTAFYFIFIF